jgi:hypothetical protein
MSASLADQMLAPAKTDFQASFIRTRKERLRIDRAIRQPDARKEALRERLPPRRKRPPGPTAVETARLAAARGLIGSICHARRSTHASNAGQSPPVIVRQRKNTTMKG